ncbi:hypothetical protein LPTSP4_00070 [Leptospira ryugenii]|uniref:Uncharacterized protein n=1 Tax=Leptospira ryugenii TaxID=1917863 RepID=A0A2P2DV39_9LEPT|nr:hypothetical protein [Leptospira ryugenii]GBF48508.1 hypothetical protein LPTSP4_00070 [Leptospira ryugenii]
MTIVNLSLVFLILFSCLAFVDGIYLHLWKYKLYKYRETIFEHLLHTLRAFLFPFQLVGLFLFDIQGWLFGIVLLVAIADLGIQIIDMWVEKGARVRFGGLSSAEYILHVTLTSLHTSMLLLYLISKPNASNFLGKTQIVFAEQWNSIVASNLLPGAILVALLHLILCHPYFRDHQDHYADSPSMNMN